MNIQIDVLMCIGPHDLNRLWEESVLSCIKYFPFLSCLYIVSPSKDFINEKIKKLKIHEKIVVLADEEVLDPWLHEEDGWYKQQLIKLEAFKICTTRFVACLSSDTLLCQTLDQETLFSSSKVPILFYFQDEKLSAHHAYEKLRLEKIENILQIELKNAKYFNNFILDFTIWDMQNLKLLKQYLIHLYGKKAFKNLSPGKCDTLIKKRSFGEWSLYAAFVLDVLQSKVEVRGFDENYFFQVHSQKDFQRFQYQSKIVHFVNKSLDFQLIKSQWRSRCSTSA